jgi:hypothetical protein
VHERLVLGSIPVGQIPNNGWAMTKRPPYLPIGSQRYITTFTASLDPKIHSNRSYPAKNPTSRTNPNAPGMTWRYHNFLGMERSSAPNLTSAFYRRQVAAGMEQTREQTVSMRDYEALRINLLCPGIGPGQQARSERARVGLSLRYRDSAW